MTCSKSSEPAPEKQGFVPQDVQPQTDAQLTSEKVAQPTGYLRADAEARIAEKLKRFERLPDAAIVTVFLGDLRQLA